MTNLIAFCYIMIAMFVGEWVSKRSKAYIPSIFITAMILVIGFWTVVPKNIIVTASYGQEFIAVILGLLLVHLGTLMNLKKLLQQWRAVCVALLGVCGTMIFTLTIGSMIFGWRSVVSTVPPLTGGLVAAALMTTGLKGIGATALVAYPVSMYVVHHIIGFPIISVLLKREGRRLKAIYAASPTTYSGTTTSSSQTVQPKKTFGLGNAYETPAFILAKIAAVAVFSYWVGGLMHNVINSTVLCLIFGVIFHQIGFLEDNALNKAGVFNWLMYGLLAYILAELNATTPQIIGSIIIQILVLIAMGLLGMYLASIILAKPLKMSHDMAFACALTALCGFPADYILTTEVVNQLSTDQNERTFLLDSMLPKMLVGGFATVSVASIIISSIFLKML